ncbi:MAG TPA: MoaD/ThiS family protein [Burkholderiaceae bacterium]|nr:MoaD/ThiS family protein [Burkholderiaceae bacterium]
MKVRVKYFASIREALGPGETVALEEGMTVGHLRDRLIQRSPLHAQALARSRALRCALDQAMCDETAALRDDAEVAFFPPVTGG